MTEVAEPRHRSQQDELRAEPWVIYACIAFVLMLVTIIAASTSRGNHAVAQPVHSTTSINSAAPSHSQPSAAPKPAAPIKVAQSPPRHQEQTYKVKPGDNLTVIAAWFHQPLTTFYQANLKTVGADWNLIFPGEVLRVIT